MNKNDDIKKQIEDVRKKLNSMLDSGAKKSEIYKVSLQLDELIVKFMKMTKE